MFKPSSLLWYVMVLSLAQPFRFFLPLPQVIGKGLSKMGIGEVHDHFIPRLFFSSLLWPLSWNQFYKVQFRSRQSLFAFGGLPGPSAGRLWAEAKIDDLGSVHFLVLGGLEKREGDAFFRGDGLANVDIDDCFFVAKEELLGLDWEGEGLGGVGMGGLCLLSSLSFFHFILGSPIHLLPNPCPHPTLLHWPILASLDHF